MLNYSISEHDSAQFARLSGDFNPLHVDPIAARRLQFGGTICHGVHLVLKALDLATASGLLKAAHIDTIGSVFGGSVRTGRPVEVELLREPGSNRLRLAAASEGRAVFTVKLTLADPAPATQQQHGKLPASSAAAEPSAPLEPDFPSAATLAELASAVSLGANRALMRQLLPSLAEDPQACELTADLLATTCIVGMKCPGLHSIYSEFKLRRLAVEVKTPVTQMTFSVQRADPRFRSVRLAVSGARFVGTLDAFFRAPPVAQPLLSELQTRVAPSQFKGQHALIVGGSRGLGELVVKILLAGGAKVTLSYARGKDDAERIRQEAEASGSQVEILQLDASQPLPDATIRHLETLPLTHLYYFATQQISKNSSASWSQSLFDGFCQLYVHGFAALVQAATQKPSAGGLLQVLYPSTVFLDQAESGFAEYCAAKAAGESLCEHLALRPGLVVHKPRLPRLQTDQNSSFMGVEGAEPFPVMLQLLQSLQPTRAPLTEPSSNPE
jgi:hypothetical protein